MMYYRRLPRFEYSAPKSIEEASTLLQKYKGDARVTAGGTIVIHRMKERVGVRKYLIGLKNIPELDYITFDESSGLKIGALATLQSIADSALVRERFGILSTACGRLGTPQIRNMGTIGGNVCSKFPTAETVPALIALGAEAKIVAADGKRMVSLEDLNKELKQTDMLTEIRIPPSSDNMKWSYEKFAVRERLDYATVSAAVMILPSNGRCEDCKIALGGVTSKRAKEAEAGAVTAELYSGVVKLAIASSADFERVKKFEEFLAQVKDLQLVSVGGSADEGTMIVVSVEKPIPLLSVLSHMPLVERVVKKDRGIEITLKAKQ